MSEATWQHWYEVPSLAPRPEASHKGDYGHVLVIAGSTGMGGAAALVGESAQRAGAGLVTVACPDTVTNMVTGWCPTLMTVPLRVDSWGGLARTNIRKTIELKGDVLAVGPGLGSSPGVDALIEAIVRHRPEPLVLDADGLNALARSGQVALLRERPGPTVITPHPGEFARLVGRSIDDVQSNRESMAAQFAKDHRVVVVLKGSSTVITDGERVAVNGTGNAGMATGGAGDVLTGLIAGLIAQKMSVADAARLAVHLHGMAGDHVAWTDDSPQTLIATDLIDAFPAVFRRFR